MVRKMPCRKQPKCPLTDEWIKKMWHIYTMEYYSAIKRNEIELIVVRWMDLESVIQSEVSQKENVENGLEDMGRGKGKLGRSERVALTYIHYQV